MGDVQFPSERSATKAGKPRLARARPVRVRVPRSSAVESGGAIVLPQKSKVGGKPYYEAVGRRKEAIARVRLFSGGQGLFTVEGRALNLRFPTPELQRTIISPLEAVGQGESLDVSVHVSGGGVRGQSEAIRLGISRALLKLNPIFRKALKKEGYLKRDSRVKERKKYGLKRARRAPQFSKR